MSQDLPRTAVGPLMDRWLTGRLARGEIAASTERQQRLHVEAFTAHVGPATPLEAVTIDDLEDWVASLAHNAASTRNTKLSTIRSFFAWSTERSYIEVNPCIWLKRVRQPKLLPRRIPRQQLDQVLSKAPFRERTMIILMLQLGLRRAELADLCVESWDRDGDKIRVIGKGSKERVLPLTSEAREALEAWCTYLAHCGHEAGPLWPSSQVARGGMSKRTISMNITRVSNDLGLHITPHQYRHTMASDAVEAGMALPALSVALGHENWNTTKRYVSVSGEQLRDGLEGRSYRKGGHPAPTEGDRKAGS